MNTEWNSKSVALILSDQAGFPRYEIQMVAKFSDHNCTVWRTSWNVTGTMLASTGDDGCVRMWKSIETSSHN